MSSALLLILCILINQLHQSQLSFDLKDTALSSSLSIPYAMPIHPNQRFFKLKLLLHECKWRPWLWFGMSLCVVEAAFAKVILSGQKKVYVFLWSHNSMHHTKDLEYICARGVKLLYVFNLSYVNICTYRDGLIDLSRIFIEIYWLKLLKDVETC